jgi:hypothetical protein
LKALLAKRSSRRSIGLLVTDREMAVCVIAGTPLGRVELFQTVEPREAEPLDDQIGRLLEPWMGRRPRPKVVLGIPEVRVFHATREQAVNVRKDPEVWLQESLRSAGTRIEEMIIDTTEVPLGKKVMAGLVACRKKWMNDALEALNRRSSRLALVEPTPCALLRAANEISKTPRGAKLTARFLLGDRQAMGILVAGGVPLHWRLFDLPPGEEPLAIHSALVRLRMQARSWRAETEIDSVVIQGRPELGPKLGPVEFGQRTGMKITRAHAPGYQPQAIARGLALGALVEEKGFDLSRTFKTRESIGEIFPWADLVMQSAMLLGVMLLMSEQAHSLEKSLDATRSSMAKFPWLGNRQEADLEKERKTLEQKDKTAEAFLASRVLWSNYVRDVASQMPDNTRMSSLQGAGELENLGGKGPPGPLKKSFVMRLETPIPPTGETPREVDDFLGSLRDRALLKQEFPVIELKDLKNVKAPGKGTEAVASYNIVCLPPATKPGAAKAKK